MEDVAYQKAAIQEMERAMLPVVPMKPQGDKRSAVAGGRAVHQERHGAIPAERMRGIAGADIQPGRGESHDDLNDACVYLIQGLANQGLELPKIQWIEA